MTYRVAHVRFAESEQTYPVNCNRADLQPGDRVVVEMPDQAKRLKVAHVDRVEFLNWNCANTIVCRRSEFMSNDDGTWSVKREQPATPVLETLDDLATRLRQMGWQSFWPKSKVWRTVYAREYRHAGALIALHSKGMAFQVLEAGCNLGIFGRSISVAPTRGRFVRHVYHASEEDLLKFAVLFAEDVGRDGADLKPYFEPKGHRPSKGPMTHERNELAEIRDAINGGAGGPAYLGDGVWI